VGILFTFLTVVVVFCSLAADAGSALAAVLPPETSSPEEKPVPSEETVQPGRTTHPENPFDESAKSDQYEASRRRREMTTIYIILGVVLLLCAYWWTSGKLHHRIPK